MAKDSNGNEIKEYPKILYPSKVIVNSKEEEDKITGVAKAPVKKKEEDNKDAKKADGWN